MLRVMRLRHASLREELGTRRASPVFSFSRGGRVVVAGRAHGTYHVEAPATTGAPTFERYFRVHQNSMEALVVFIPALMLSPGTTRTSSPR